jgi:hypothetical protein
MEKLRRNDDAKRSGWIRSLKNELKTIIDIQIIDLNILP